MTRLTFFAAALCLASSAFGAYPERGYQARPCGLDMNRNGIWGEAADCQVCDGTTTDPDGDTVDEDLIYVDCSAGADVPSCGSPASPCGSVEYAWTVRADGPGGDAEDILCLRGVCIAEELVNPGVSGVPGTYTVTASGSEVRDWQYPSDPTMLVGWDSDGDGAYPPFDSDDVAVLDGSAGLARAFQLDAQNGYLEMAHFTARNYGRFTAESNSGFLRFGSSSGGADHIYVHDLHLESINQDRASGSALALFNLFGGLTRPRWVQFSNLLVTDNGGWFGRGEAVPGEGVEVGPLRWQNVTRTAHGCDATICGGGVAASTAFRLWGYMSGIEILDSIWDSNVQNWTPNTMGGPPGARFVSAAQCSRDWMIRNNEVINMKTALEVQGWSNGFCDGADARPVDQVVFDANVVRNGFTAWTGGDHGIELREGGDDPGEVVGTVIVTNNFLSSSAGWEAGVWVRHGHDTLSVPGQVVIANNTIYGDINRHAAIVVGNVEGADFPFRPQNVAVKNNLVGGLDPSDLNVETTYAPALFDADWNVYDPGASFNWAGVFQPTFANWMAVTGGDANSKTCEPQLTSPVAFDFRLSAFDTCAVDSGTPLAAFLDRDLDGETRPAGAGWEIGGDELQPPLFADNFESGNIGSWSRSVP